MIPNGRIGRPKHEVACRLSPRAPAKLCWTSRPHPLSHWYAQLQLPNKRTFRFLFLAEKARSGYHVGRDSALADFWSGLKGLTLRRKSQFSVSGWANGTTLAQPSLEAWCGTGVRTPTGRLLPWSPNCWAMCHSAYLLHS
jgi:hypothetical protein